MTRTTRVLGLAAALLLLAPQWAGADDEKYAGRKFYAGLGAVAGIPAFDLPSTVGQQNGWGLDVRGGYRLFSHLAAELQWQWIQRYETTSGLGSHLGTLQTNTVTANAKGFIFTGPIQPYLLFGLGLQNGNLNPGKDATEFAIRVGGGGQFFFTEHIGIFGEIIYLKPFGSLQKFGSVPIAFGGLYQF